MTEEEKRVRYHRDAGAWAPPAVGESNTPSAGVSITLPELATVEMQEVICDHIFGDWRREDLATQARCKSEAVDLYNAIVTFGTRSATEEFRPSAEAVAKAREYMGEPEERNRVKESFGKLGRMVNGNSAEGVLLSSIIDDGEVLAREILRLHSVADRKAP